MGCAAPSPGCQRHTSLLPPALAFRAASSHSLLSRDKIQKFKDVRLRGPCMRYLGTIMGRHSERVSVRPGACPFRKRFAIGDLSEPTGCPPAYSFGRERTRPRDRVGHTDQPVSVEGADGAAWARGLGELARELFKMRRPHCEKPPVAVPVRKGSCSASTASAFCSPSRRSDTTTPSGSSTVSALVSLRSSMRFSPHPLSGRSARSSGARLAPSTVQQPIWPRQDRTALMERPGRYR